jgi:hypothetical protein
VKVLSNSGFDLTSDLETAARRRPTTGRWTRKPLPEPRTRTPSKNATSATFDCYGANTR